MSPRIDSRAIDYEINAVMACQHGVISASQLRELGATSEMVATRVRSGRLVRAARGVYVGGGSSLSRPGELMVALMTGGDNAHLTATTALEVADCLRRTHSTVHVVTSGTPRASSQACIHRSRWLPPAQLLVRGGLRSVCVERALVDWAMWADPYDLIEPMHEGQFRRRFQLSVLERISQRLCNAPGRASMRFAMDQHRAGSRGIWSSHERFFVRLVRDAGLPLPFVNLPVETPRGTFVVDDVWPSHRCCVEIDDPHGHSRVGSAAVDLERSQGLASGGWRLLRIHPGRMYADPDGVVGDVARLLGL